MFKTQPSTCASFGIWSFEFWSCFVFRASNFASLVLSWGLVFASQAVAASEVPIETVPAPAPELNPGADNAPAPRAKPEPQPTTPPATDIRLRPKEIPAAGNAGTQQPPLLTLPTDQKQLFEAPQGTLPDQAAAEDFVTRLDALLQSFDERRGKRLETLHQQIQLLDRVLQQPPDRDGRPDDSSASGPGGVGSDHAAETVAKEAATGTGREPTEKPPIVPPDAAEGTQPVDPQGLADSLFGVGETQLAFDAYRRLAAEGLSETDRRWVRYQLASCQRRMGQTGSAEQEYRELLAADNEDSIAVLARWWLATTQRRKQLASSLQAVEEALKTLQAEAP